MRCHSSYFPLFLAAEAHDGIRVTLCLASTLIPCATPTAIAQDAKGTHIQKDPRSSAIDKPRDEQEKEENMLP